MDSAIDRHLRQTEQRESHLWILAFALLALFGTVIIGHYSVVLLDEPGSHPGLTRATTYRALGGLFFLVALFCLYVLRALLVNRKMKSLLVELSNVAASGMELDDFLPSIARKIATTSSVTACRIALLSREQTALTIATACVNDGASSPPGIGKTYPLAELRVWERVADDLRPAVLSDRDMDRLSSADRELLASGTQDVRSVLIVPMVTRNGIVGIIILARTGGRMPKRFTAFRIAMARTLARHAASAIDQSRLKKDAIRDSLTNLYNRRHFAERIREEIARAERERHVMVILMCDLDRFKNVNDTRGHQTGDAVLKAAAERIRGCTRGVDLVFRWGGDEIVVVLPKSSREGALIVANRIRQGVLGTARAAGLDFDVSIGAALYPDHGRDEDRLIQVADRALYIAKRHGGKVQIGDEEYRLNAQSASVVFQPVVDLRSERILGYEVLARGPSGKLSAAELFKKYRAVGKLGELKQILFTSQIGRATKLGLRKVFINVDFDVLGRLEPIPIPPGLEVVLELSEGEALRDVEGLLDVARSWRDKGYEFALDDFGAGFVSLPFLAMLVPQYVKVDRSTVLQAAASRQFRGFLKSLVQALRAYATAGIIGEGIETRQELQILNDVGISMAQGYLLGRPQELTESPESDVSSEARDVRRLERV
jgi:diguanylate cyclase (GGDEF)-like protein